MPVPDVVLGAVERLITRRIHAHVGVAAEPSDQIVVAHLQHQLLHPPLPVWPWHTRVEVWCFNDTASTGVETTISRTLIHVLEGILADSGTIEHLRDYPVVLGHASIDGVANDIDGRNATIVQRGIVGEELMALEEAERPLCVAARRPAWLDKLGLHLPHKRRLTVSPVVVRVVARFTIPRGVGKRMQDTHDSRRPALGQPVEDDHVGAAPTAPRMLGQASCGSLQARRPMIAADIVAGGCPRPRCTWRCRISCSLLA
mmetsp:Transcript_6973/g.24802  ORF Transcript_6973/g.24802 Transcript_6973/m.24802 type:complete len:258 (+) Transcript_6973:379-1152(+)